MTRQRSQKIFKILFDILILLLCLVQTSCKTSLSFCEKVAKLVNSDLFIAHYIDVGQGDCAIIQCGGESMIIDSGEAEYSEKVIEYLNCINVSELDYAVATHPHSDHIGGFSKILNEIDTENIIMPNVTSDSKDYDKLMDCVYENDINVIHAESGNSYSFGESSFAILAPENKDYIDINNYSVVIRFSYLQTSFLFTGDAEYLSEQDMLNSGHLLQADILKIGHHGSKSSTSSLFLQAVNPTIAVISVGANSYGHPHNTVLSLLKRTDTIYYCTLDFGCIVILSDGTGYRVVTEK